MKQIEEPSSVLPVMVETDVSMVDIRKGKHQTKKGGK
jgi:hypothetical protein